MNDDLFELYERILSDYDVTGSVLEVGVSETQRTLLSSGVLADANRKVGVDLQSRSMPGTPTVRGNANEMPFNTDTFDIILCNAMLHHDPYFWETLAEIRRVGKPGALVALGVPGYTKTNERPRRFARLGLDRIGDVLHRLRRYVLKVRRTQQEFTNSAIQRSRSDAEGRATNGTSVLDYVKKFDKPGWTPTYPVHEAPGDYYRFSERSVQKILLAGMTNKNVVETMFPPRLVGWGELTRSQPADSTNARLGSD